MCGSGSTAGKAATDSNSETNISFLSFEWNQWHAQSIIGGYLIGIIFILFLIYCGCTQFCGCPLPCNMRGVGRRRRRRQWQGSAYSLSRNNNDYAMSHFNSNRREMSTTQLLNTSPAFTPAQWSYIQPLIQQRAAITFAGPPTVRSSAPALPPPTPQPATSEVDWESVYQRMQNKGSDK